MSGIVDHDEPSPAGLASGPRVQRRACISRLRRHTRSHDGTLAPTPSTELMRSGQTHRGATSCPGLDAAFDREVLRGGTRQVVSG